MVLTLGSYFATGASAITYLLAARALGPPVFGLLSGAIGIVILTAAFADFGINGWVIRALARSPSSSDLFTRTLTAKLVLALLLAIAWVVVSLTALDRSSLKLAVALLAGYLASQVVVGTLTVPFRASENMVIVSVVGVVEKAVTLGVWLAMQGVTGYRPEGLPIALVAGGGASIVCATILIPRQLLSVSTPSIREVIGLWKSSYSFGMVGVSSQIQRVDVAIVSLVAGSYAAGVYAAPARLTTFLSVIPASFSAAVFPRIARSAVDGTSQRPELISAGAMLGVMVILLGALAIAAPVLVPLVLGHAYVSSVGVLRIYLLVVLINSANQPLVALLQAAGHEHFVGRAMIAAAVVGLLAVAVGAGTRGAEGAAEGALILQLMQLGLFASKMLRTPRAQIASRVVADVTDVGLDVSWRPADPGDKRAGY